MNIIIEALNEFIMQLVKELSATKEQLPTSLVTHMEDTKYLTHV